MTWQILGGEKLGLITLVLMLVGSGAFSVGAYHAGLRQWPIPWTYLAGGYAGSVVAILIIARGLIALCWG